MRSFLFAMPLLVAVAGAGQGQRIDPSDPSNPSGAGGAVTERQAIAVGQCPVGMMVQQQGWGNAEWTVAQEDAQKASSGIARGTGNSGVNVALKAPSGKALSRVEVVVYYFEPRARVLPVAGGGDAAPELTKTFELVANGGSAGEISRSLLVGTAAGITRVQLMSVKYADGETWSGTGCSVKPSLYMPVGQ